MGEKSGLSLMFAVLVDASASWRGVEVTPAISRQLKELRPESGDKDAAQRQRRRQIIPRTRSPSARRSGGGERAQCSVTTTLDAIWKRTRRDWTTPVWTRAWQSKVPDTVRLDSVMSGPGLALATPTPFALPLESRFR